MPKKKKPSLTPRQRAIVRNLAKGMTQADAAEKAGYSPKNAKQSGYQAMKALHDKAGELLAKHGLTDDAFIDQYLLPALNAKEVQASLTKFGWEYSKPLVAWNPRVKAMDTFCKIRGFYAREDSGPAGGININFILDAPRPMIDANRNRTAIDTAE